MVEPTYDELKARLEQLEKNGARRTGELDFKVGEKGGVSVYGLGRFRSPCITNSGTGFRGFWRGESLVRP
jgi:hypothetical protein